MTNPLNPFASELSFNFRVAFDGDCDVKQAVLNGIDEEMRMRTLCSLVRCAIAVGIIAYATAYPIGWLLSLGLYAVIYIMMCYDVASSAECRMGHQMRDCIDGLASVDLNDLMDNLNGTFSNLRYTDITWQDWVNPAVVLHVMAGVIVCTTV